MSSIVLEQEVIAAAITTALVVLYLHASDVHRLCSEALTFEIGFLQNIRSYKKWIPLYMEKKSFPSKESDTKILQSIYFAFEVDIISSYSNRIHI